MTGPATSHALPERSQSAVNHALRRVAVDLTPMLPGGANGGAKVFVVRLLEDLARFVPNCEFLLLTHPATFAELANLERTNVRCVLLPAPPSQPTPLSLRSIGRRLMRHLPRVSKTLVSTAGTRYLGGTQRRFVSELDHQVLFCPFTAPTYHSPAVPTVCTLYDLQYKEYPQFFTPEDLKYRDDSFLDAVQYASHVAAISEYSRASALTYANLEPERIVTIWLRLAQRIRTISVERCQEVLAALGLDYGRYLFYPANFWLHKNHEVLLRSFSIARNSGLPGDIKLVLTGNADARQQAVKEMLNPLGLNGSVVIPGFVDDNRFEVLLNGCAGLVFPSLFEGFGLPIVEAMAIGKPVACSRVTSLPEVAGEAALMFDPRIPAEIAAAMASLVSDQPLRERLIAAGFERARTFHDSMQMAREYWALFESARVAQR